MFPSFIGNGCLRVKNVILEICFAYQKFMQIRSLVLRRSDLKIVFSLVRILIACLFAIEFLEVKKGLIFKLSGRSKRKEKADFEQIVLFEVYSMVFVAYNSCTTD